MGATVITGKQAAAFQVNGKKYYAVFEETYDKNCHSAPTWSCYAFGEIDAALKHITLAAASCNSGMLQSKNGDIKIMSHINSWLQLLKNPVQMPNIMVDFANYFFSEKKIDAMCSVAIDFGMVELADVFKNGGQYQLPLWENADFFTKLFKVVQAWNFLPRQVYTNTPQPELGYAPNMVPAPAYTPPEFIFNGDFSYLKKTNGIWESCGCSSDILGKFIKDAWLTEILYSGYLSRFFAKDLELLENTVKEAPTISNGSVVLLKPHCDIRKFEEYLSSCEYGFKIIIDDLVLKNKNLLYKLFELSTEDATWIVHQSCAPNKQLDLFA